jgi:hypothetical protein
LNLNELKHIQTTDSQSKSDEKDSGSTQNVDPTSTNKGKLQLDATIADANIKFPTDLGLLNSAREKSEKLIDIFCNKLQIEKPRTYRITARKKWLNLSKKKRKSSKEIRKGVGQQLNYLKRNLKHIDRIVNNIL